jgi:hypothetical protein
MDDKKHGTHTHAYHGIFSAIKENEIISFAGK